jgi:hypothetical protein
METCWPDLKIVTSAPTEMAVPEFVGEGYGDCDACYWVWRRGCEVGTAEVFVGIWGS